MKKRIALALIIGISTIGQAQDLGNDITVKYNQALQRSNESLFGLEYRRAIGQNFKMKFGTNYGKSDKSIWLGDNVLFGSDSITIIRDLASFSKKYSVYAGVDYEGIDYLSLGASFILGTNQTLLGAYDRGARYDTESNDWVNCIECVYDYHGEELPPWHNGGNSTSQYANAIKITNYVVYGLSLRAAIRIPIKKRFEFTIGYEPTFVRNKMINETEFETLDETYTNKASAFNVFTHTVTAALRYKF
ncbi:MAG: hypothetical protein ACI8ZM_004372 [Crocinitomix sp.]|jgi:hypothetical protein